MAEQNFPRVDILRPGLLRADRDESRRGERLAQLVAPLVDPLHNGWLEGDAGKVGKAAIDIDVSTCGHCGGTLRIVAGIEAPTAIRAILAHFAKHGAREKAHYRPAPRAPPAVAA